MGRLSFLRRIPGAPNSAPAPRWHPLFDQVFDQEWYLARYEDVAIAGVDPANHYRTHGWREGRDPAPLFDTSWYLSQRPALREGDVDPLSHFLNAGGTEGADPHPLFDSDWYLAQNRDCLDEGFNPLVHYLRTGSAAGRAPHVLFEPAWFGLQAAHLESGQDPLRHYLTDPRDRAVSPHPLFDGELYLLEHPEVSGPPLLHYVREGSKLGFNPCATFDTGWFTARYPEVLQNDTNPLQYFLGSPRLMDPHPLFDADWYSRQVGWRRLEGNVLLHYLAIGAPDMLDPHPLFASRWYFSQYPPDARSGDALSHFLKVGRRDGKSPHPLFHSAHYSSKYPEVATSGLDPWTHYTERGAVEGLDPHPLFAATWYVARHPDAADNPLLHYVRNGWGPSSEPHPLFDSLFYEAQLLGHATATGTALEDYLTVGSSLDRDPHPFFSTRWYLDQNPDVEVAGINPLVHFVVDGWAEGRDPGPRFSFTRYRRSDRPGVFGQPVFVADDEPPLGLDMANPLLRYLYAERDPGYVREQTTRARRYARQRSLHVFFNVARDVIGGGMLSQNRFVDNTTALFASDPEVGVVMSGLPLGNRAVEYSQFAPAQPPVAFEFIVEETDPDEVTIFLPECFAVGFASSLTSAEADWLVSRPSLKVVVMNQNNDLMPTPSELRAAFGPITDNVVITTAHSRYCTPRLASRFGYPVKQLTPFLPPMRHRSYQEKDRIIMLSPDSIEDDPEGVTREQVVRRLQSGLPGFQVVTVANLSLEQYLDLASRAMFSVTFGEGMDGYFIEPVLAGGVSFAVYNGTFFPDSFEQAPTVFNRWSELMEQIVPAIIELSCTPEAYLHDAALLRGLLEQEYSNVRSLQDLAAFFRGEVDHDVSPWVEVRENDAHLKAHMADAYGFRFVEPESGAYAMITPDGLYVRHFGGEFYSVLYEVYAKRDYDFELDPRRTYVLVDIGANYGLVGLRLARMFPNICRVYAYEPAEPTARLARKNIRDNPVDAEFVFKQVGLSNYFGKKELRYIPDWSTAFSTDNEVLLPQLLASTAHQDLEKPLIEVEVVPASSEFERIITDRGDARIIIKCDTQGSEFGIFSDLARAGQLEAVDAVIIETHFRPPDEIVAVLESAGFVAKLRLDSAANTVYTLTARRSEQIPPAVVGASS